ncbi:hypothetical protein FPV67DRAFT_1775882 [Lyophyllum atratum]|nr:hypothetical protein FPV67DRAFT_1775882 [Lyophyllum atratum]
MLSEPITLSLASSSNGRVSGKVLESPENCHLRSHLPDGVKTKSWEDRMRQTQKALSIKKLQTELHEEKQAEFQRRREITQERKKAAEERRRLEEDKAKTLDHSLDGGEKGRKTTPESRTKQKD